MATYTEKGGISMNKFDITPEFAEELGAYLEGNLSVEDNCRIDELISINEDLHLLVDDVSYNDLQFANDLLFQQEIMDLGINFNLPELPYDSLDEAIELPLLNIEQPSSILDDLAFDNNFANSLDQYNEDLETDYNINDLIQ